VISRAGLKRGNLGRASLILIGACGAVTGPVLVTSCRSDTGSGTRFDPTQDVTLVPDLRIDGHQNELVPVHFLAVRSDGTVAVAQSMDNAIRFFDAQGTALATVGRTGDGPGEFLVLSQVGWLGDTLWVSDGRLRRVTFISPDLSVARTANLPHSAGPRPADIGRYPEFRVVIPWAMQPDGTLAAALVGPGGPLADQWNGQWTWYFHLTQEGRIVRAIGREPDSGHPDYSYYPTLSDGSVRGWPFPFVYRPRWVWSPAGDRAAYVFAGQTEGGAAIVGAVMLNATGDTIFEARYPMTGEQLPRSVADSAIAAIASTRLGDAASVWIRQAEAHIPAVFPPVEPGSFIGNDGRLWVRLRSTPVATRYLLLNAHGQQTGTVTVPSNVTLRTADATHAWGVELDDHDVPSLVRYRIPEVQD
jgi:hypothetical protein